MKYFAFLPMTVLILFFLSSCMPQPVVRQIPATYNRAEVMFEEAEQRYKAKKYEEAVRMFNNVIAEFPDSPESAVALMKNGMIYKELGKFHEARRFFQKLIEQHPPGRLVDDAKIEILNTYLSEGNYQQTIRLASRLFKRSADGTYPPQVYMVVGNAYLMADEPENAVKLYTMAFKIASQSEKDLILEKLKSGIRQIPSDSLRLLIDQMDDKFPKGYLMYQLGLNHTEVENYKEAISVLNDFIQKFPSHSESMQAKNLLDNLQKQPEKEKYIIGCLLPLSGKYEKLGQLAWAGIEFALSQFSSKYKNPVIKIMVRDTGSDAAQTSKALADLASENAAAIIGPMINAEAAAQEAQNQKIPIITLTLAKNVTDYGDFVFRNFLTPEMQIKSMVSFMINTFGLKRFAVLYPKESYGATFMNLFWDEVVSQGGVVVGAQSYDITLTDFREPIKKLSGHFGKVSDDLLRQHLYQFLGKKASSEDLRFSKAIQKPAAELGAVFIPDSPAKAGMILPQLAYYDISGVYALGTNLWHSEKFIEMAGNYSQKAILTDGFFAESSNPYVQSFRQKFEVTYGHVPGFVEAVAFDTANLLMEILALQNIEHRSQLRDALIQVRDFPGVTGKTSFDPTGEAQKEAYVLCIKNEQFMEMKRP